VVVVQTLRVDDGDVGLTVFGDEFFSPTPDILSQLRKVGTSVGQGDHVAG